MKFEKLEQLNRLCIIKFTSHFYIIDNTTEYIPQTSENEFYLIGSGIFLTFKNVMNPYLMVEILIAHDGRFDRTAGRLFYVLMVIKHTKADIYEHFRRRIYNTAIRII